MLWLFKFTTCARSCLLFVWSQLARNRTRYELTFVSVSFLCYQAQTNLKHLICRIQTGAHMTFWMITLCLIAISFYRPKLQYTFLLHLGWVICNEIKSWPTSTNYLVLHLCWWSMVMSLWQRFNFSTSPTSLACIPNFIQNQIDISNPCGVVIAVLFDEQI